MSHSQEVTNPSGGACPQRETTQPALDDDFMERVLASENLHSAFYVARFVKSMFFRRTSPDSPAAAGVKGGVAGEANP